MHGRWKKQYPKNKNKLPASVDVVHKRNEHWFFWSDDWILYGPYGTKQRARNALHKSNQSLCERRRCP